ncbi:MAG TPA: DUF4199 domain-containing protein [Parafilimonas sp.]|nr:DUF4199 domain-containing protein [Parafilimonas sp.]
METKVTTPQIKGLIISLIIIVYSVAGHLLNIYLESWFGWIGVVILLVGIIWSTIVYGTQMNNNVTFGNLFGHGFKVTAVVICITFIFLLLSVYVLFPDTIDQIVQYQSEKAIESGKMTSEQLQQALPMMKKFTPIGLFGGSVIFDAVIGAIGALIGAAVTKKKPQDPFGNQAM